eukprot:s876_g13.t2
MAASVADSGVKSLKDIATTRKQEKRALLGSAWAQRVLGERMRQTLPCLNEPVRSMGGGRAGSYCQGLTLISNVRFCRQVMARGRHLCAAVLLLGALGGGENCNHILPAASAQVNYYTIIGRLDLATLASGTFLLPHGIQLPANTSLLGAPPNATVPQLTTRLVLAVPTAITHYILRLGSHSEVSWLSVDAQENLLGDGCCKCIVGIYGNFSQISYVEAMGTRTGVGVYFASPTSHGNAVSGDGSNETTTQRPKATEDPELKVESAESPLLGNTSAEVQAQVSEAMQQAKAKGAEEVEDAVHDAKEKWVDEARILQLEDAAKMDEAVRHDLANVKRKVEALARAAAKASSQVPRTPSRLRANEAPNRRADDVEPARPPTLPKYLGSRCPGFLEAAWQLVSSAAAQLTPPTLDRFCMKAVRSTQIQALQGMADDVKAAMANITETALEAAVDTTRREGQQYQHEVLSPALQKIQHEEGSIEHLQSDALRHLQAAQGHAKRLGAAVAVAQGVVQNFTTSPEDIAAGSRENVLKSMAKARSAKASAESTLALAKEASDAADAVLVEANASEAAAQTLLDRSLAQAKQLQELDQRTAVAAKQASVTELLRKAGLLG